MFTAVLSVRILSQLSPVAWLYIYVPTSVLMQYYRDQLAYLRKFSLSFRFRNVYILFIFSPSILPAHTFILLSFILIIILTIIIIIIFVLLLAYKLNITWSLIINTCLERFQVLTAAAVNTIVWASSGMLNRVLWQKYRRYRGVRFFHHQGYYDKCFPWYSELTSLKSIKYKHSKTTMSLPTEF
jgi:hypothetical protein